MDNNINKTFILTLLILCGLLAMYFIPEIPLWEGKASRQVNLLSDIMENEDSAKIKELEAKMEAALNIEDSVPEGVVPIIDFVDDSTKVRQMDNFYAKLDALAKDTTGTAEPVRIAIYGDSYIQGDIMVEHLRDLLQDKFGGGGVGAVNIACAHPGYRASVLQHSNGLTEYDMNNKEFKAARQGLSCAYTYGNGSATYRTTDQTAFGIKHNGKAEHAIVYFAPRGGATVSAAVNGGAMQQIYKGTSPEVQAVELNGPIENITLNVSGGANTDFFFTSLESRGVVVDNFGVQGASGMHLLGISDQTFFSFAKARKYDLVILEFGLNACSPGQKNFTFYIDQMTKVIERYQKAFPDVSMLVFSASDRAKRAPDGTLKTMNGVQELVLAQSDMAKNGKVAFWNLYKALTNEGGVARLTELGEAQKDYVHVNRKGGKRIAGLFYKAIITGYDNYRRRHPEE